MREIDRHVFLSCNLKKIPYHIFTFLINVATYHKTGKGALYTEDQGISEAYARPYNHCLHGRISNHILSILQCT